MTRRAPLFGVLFLGACASGSNEAREPARSAAPETGARAQDAGGGAVPEGSVAVAVDGPPVVPDAGLLPPAEPSTSIGGPNDGHLKGGVPLPWQGPGFALNPRRLNTDSFYGTSEMIGAIERGAFVVNAEMAGSTLVVNDIGFREGGVIPHHGSHRAGRDADILFYLTDLQGRPVESRGVVIEPDGTGMDFKDLADPADDEPVKLDARRTWRFVRALVEDPDALVQRLFVAEHVRTLLLAEAARVRAPRFAIERAGDAMCQPSPPHDDHIHARLFCTIEDLRDGCLDGYPMYPWRRRDLAAAGFPEPLMATRPRRERTRTPTAEPVPGAPRQVLHRKVRELLARRQAWTPTPHPGRPWCN